MNRLLFRVIYYPTMAFLKLVDMVYKKGYRRWSYKFLRFCGVKFTGTPNYISSDVYVDACELITLGQDCVISKKVVLLTHDYSLTTGMKAIGKLFDKDKQIIGEIKVGDNVFIGLGAMLLPGTTIGDNCIIGAGSVVKGLIPDNSVVVGNPAKVVCSIQDYASKKVASWDKLNVR